MPTPARALRDVAKLGRAAAPRRAGSPERPMQVAVFLGYGIGLVNLPLRHSRLVGLGQWERPDAPDKGAQARWPQRAKSVFNDSPRVAARALADRINSSGRSTVVRIKAYYPLRLWLPQ